MPDALLFKEKRNKFVQGKPSFVSKKKNDKIFLQRRDTGYGIRDTGYGIRDTGYGIRDTGYGIRDTGYKKSCHFFFD